MTTNGLAQFDGQQFLNLETYRRNGQAMPTPVWFAEENGVLYIRTINGAGKAKRIANNQHVRVMACGVRGEPIGEWVDADAELLTGDAAAHPMALLASKYEVALRTMTLPPEIAARGYVVIAVKVRA